MNRTVHVRKNYIRHSRPQQDRLKENVVIIKELLLVLHSRPGGLSTRRILKMVDRRKQLVGIGTERIRKVLAKISKRGLNFIERLKNSCLKISADFRQAISENLETLSLTIHQKAYA